MSNAIGFYPDLVQEMMREHRILLDCFANLINCAKIGDANLFFSYLQQFKSLLVSHLLKEAIKLYIYLRQQLKNDLEAYRLITFYKREMDDISHGAIAIIDKLNTTRGETLDFSLVTEKLDELGAVIGERIRREELELYPLYHDRY